LYNLFEKKIKGDLSLGVLERMQHESKVVLLDYLSCLGVTELQTQNEYELSGFLTFNSDK
jgi:hypothetical protein